MRTSEFPRCIIQIPPRVK